MKFYLAIYFLFVIVIHTTFAGTQIWSKILIDRIYLQNDPFIKSVYSESTILCGVLCAFRSKCNIWCFDKIKKCTLSSTVVSPKYFETSPNSALCYTKMRRDLAVGSDIYSTEPHSSETKGILTADGVFLEDYGKFFKTKHVDNAWILYDLKKPATIYEIRVSSSDAPYICEHFRLRIGNSLVQDGDFSTYEPLISITDPCDHVDGVMHYKPAFPMKGQYVSLVRFQEDRYMWFFYIEIDGEYDLI